MDQFVQNLTSAIEANVLEAVRTGLEGAGMPSRSRGAKGARSAAGSAAAARAKGQKRDAGELEALASKLRAYIVKNPGQRIEQIGKGMGAATKDLALPAKKLLAAKHLSTKGQKRATTYYPKG